MVINYGNLTGMLCSDGNDDRLTIANLVTDADPDFVLCIRLKSIYDELLPCAVSCMAVMMEKPSDRNKKLLLQGSHAYTHTPPIVKDAECAHSGSDIPVGQWQMCKLPVYALHELDMAVFGIVYRKNPHKLTNPSIHIHVNCFGNVDMRLNLHVVWVQGSIPLNDIAKNFSVWFGRCIPCDLYSVWSH